jgi:hypothetical protein
VELEGGSEHVADVERSQNKFTHKVSLSLEACFGNLDSFVAIRNT